MSQKRENRGNRALPFIIIGGVLVVAVALALVLFRSNKSEDRSQSNSASNRTSSSNANRSASLASTPQPAPRDASAGEPGAQPPHVHGDERAIVTLEEFGDYQCPPCGMFHPEVKKLEAKYGTRLRVIFRNLPLPTIHKYAEDAARAAEAAGLQGKFWEMHDLLYQQQNSWKNGPDARAIFATYARAIGLDVERFKRDMDSSEVTGRIAADMRRAESLGLTGTPSIFVNNREVTGDTLAEILKNLQDSVEAAAAAGQKP